VTGAALLALIAIGGGVAYYISLRRHPYTPCRRCEGSGRNSGSSRIRFGTCGKCGGSGRRQRFGRRFILRDR
jgi:DnaJ-class molecular chaperone